MKLSRSVKYGLALCVILGIALFLRIYFPYDNVFRDGWVNFQETDTYYNMRHVVSLALHFPHRMLFDPYAFYPGGTSIGSPPFFYLLFGFLAWIFGAGSPSEKVIETVGAYLPAILGALVTVPVFFIGKELFNKKAGLIAAALIAILPGQFLWRSMLGFPDYHIVETLLGAFTMMFLILAVKSSGQKQLSFEHLRKRDWGELRRPLIYALFAGVALGLYLLSWSGGGLFIFIIFIFVVLQYIMDHLRGRATDYLCIVTVFAFIIALLLIAPAWGQYGAWNLQFASLVIGILVFLALGAISFLMASRNIGKAWYPVALVVLGGIGLGLFYLVDASLLRSILDKLEVFTPTRGMLTVAEVQGLSISSAWYQFTTCFYLALISLAILAYLVIKDGASDKTLLFVWSMVMLVATFGQNRFAYYLAVNVALLSAYLPFKLFEFVGFKEVSKDIGKGDEVAGKKNERGWEKPRQSKKSRRRMAKTQKREQRALVTSHLTAKNFYGLVAVIVVFFLAFYPNIGVALDRVRANTGLSDDWHESLVWMRENTPDPFQNPDFYYELHGRPPAGESYQYPESAYGVMSWWDYGYSITYVAHRIPNANPSQSGAPDAASFFTGQDEASSREVLDEVASKYVIIDSDMALGKFYAMVVWAGKNMQDFFDVYYLPQNGRLVPQRLYLPAYYQSMCSRLYNFAGDAWVPSETTVISWSQEQVTDAAGNRFEVKVISDKKSFASYAEADAFTQVNPAYIIVGDNPFISPVPLEKLDHYKLVHKSPTTAVTRGNETISAVEIFEYTP